MLSFVDAAITPAEAVAYAVSRGYTDWPALESDQTLALRRGQDKIAADYNSRWSTTWLNSEAPIEVKYAIVEAARFGLTKPTALFPVVTLAEQKVLVGLDSLTWQRIPGGEGLDGFKPVLLIVEGLLDSLISPKTWAWN